MRVRLPRPRSDRPLIVCGADSLALRLVEELVQMEEPITVVVPDDNALLPRRMARLGARVVEGTPREVRTLRTAGIESARALALVDDDDVGNIHAALAAQDLNPKVRLVVRMFNLRLGQRIDDLFDDCMVLSASAIAAPFFVDAALGDTSGRLIRVGDRQLVAGPPSAVRDTVAALSGFDGDGARVLLPGPDIQPTLVLGPPRDPRSVGPLPTSAAGQPPIDPAEARRPTSAAGSSAGTAQAGTSAGTAPAAEVSVDPVGAPARPRRRGPSRTKTLLAVLRALVSVRLQLLTVALAALVAVASVIFHAGVPRLGWVDAFYFTVTTFTSTGNADLADLGASPGMKVFGAFLMLLGVLTIAVLTAVVVDDLIGARLEQTLGAPIGKLREHVVVCGLGTVGLRVAQQLCAAGVDVVGIERDPEPATYPTLRRLGIPLVHGDASEEETLRAAGVATARCVVAVTDDDVANLEAGLASRALRSDLRVVLRLFDSDLAKRVGHRLDLSISRSVSVAAAPVFAAAMMGRDVIAAVPAGRRVLLIAEVPVSPRSAAAGETVSLVENAGGIRVLGHGKDGTMTWHPGGEVRVHAGDRLVVVATRAGLADALLLTGAGADN